MPPKEYLQYLSDEALSQISSGKPLDMKSLSDEDIKVLSGKDDRTKSLNELREMSEDDVFAPMANVNARGPQNIQQGLLSAGAMGLMAAPALAMTAPAAMESGGLLGEASRPTLRPAIEGAISSGKEFLKGKTAKFLGAGGAFEAGKHIYRKLVPH